MLRPEPHPIATGLLALAVVGCGDDAQVASSSTDTGTDTGTDISTSSTTDTGTSGDTVMPPSGECGNGILELGEDCDDGKDGDNDDECTDVCRVPTCGDGFVQDALFEACDAGDAAPTDHCTAACTATHAEAWTRMHASAESGDDSVRSVAIDGGGNVIAAGYEYAGLDGTDIWVRKYDPNGEELWTYTLDGERVNSGDEARAVVVDDSDHIVAAGIIQPGAVGDDAWLAELDPQGAVVWETTWTGPEPADEVVQALDLDAQGNAYVAGYTFGQTPAIWYGKFDAQGNEVWTQAAGGSGEAFDMARAIDVDADGQAVIGGALDDDVWIRRVDPDGTEVWTLTFHAIESSLDAATGVALDADGNVLVLGSTSHIYLRKFDDTGQEIWTHVYGDERGGAEALAVAEDGTILVAGTDRLFEHDRVAYLRKLDADGNVLWRQLFDDGANVTFGRATAVRGNTIAFGGALDNGLQYLDAWVRAYVEP